MNKLNLNDLKMELQNQSIIIQKHRDVLMHDHRQNERKERLSFRAIINNIASYDKKQATDLVEGKIFKLNLRMMQDEAVFQVTRITYAHVNSVTDYSYRVETLIVGTKQEKIFNMSPDQRIYIFRK